MSEQKHCESCGMSIDDGTYCNYCTDDAGNLQSFEERFERMIQWVERHEGVSDREIAEQKTLAYMATMPAWREHPRVRAAES